MGAAFVCSSFFRIGHSANSQASYCHFVSKRCATFAPFIFCFVLIALMPNMSVAQKYTVMDIECEPEYTLICTVKPTSGWNAGAQFRLAFNYIDEKRFYYLKLSQHPQTKALLSEIFKVTPNGESKIGMTVNLYRPTGAHVRLALKRRQMRIVAICDRVVVARASDGEYTSGRIAFASLPEGAFQTSELRLQPVEDIYYGDDFTRAAQEVGTFEFAGGEWKLTGLGDPTGNPDYKANAFALKASSKGAAFAIIGYWFWDNYIAKVAVKPVRANAVGLCAFFQDERNYILLRWTNILSPEGGKCELTEVVDGKARVLSSNPVNLQKTVGFVEGRWYSLSLCATDDYLIGSIDDVVVVTARSTSFGQGKVALYVEGCEEAYFDDIEVGTWKHFYDDFVSRSLSDWRVWNGVWGLRGGTVSGQGNNAYLATGAPSWSNYEVSTSVANINGAAGIAFLCQDKNRHYLVRCAPRGNEAIVTLSLIENGSLHVLSTGKVKPWDANKWHVLKAVAKDCGILEAFVDGHLIVQAFSSSIKSGGIALYCEGSASFGEVWVRPIEARYKEPPVASQFIKEEYMLSWATSRGMWSIDQRDGVLTYWCYGRFYGGGKKFGETEIEFDWMRALQYCRELEFSFGASGREFNTGARLKILTLDHPLQVRFLIQRGNNVLAQSEWSHSGGNKGSLPMRLVASSRYIVGLVEGKPVIHVLFDEELSGNELAIRAGGRPIDIAIFKLRPSNLIDTTFWRAPVEFYPTRGTWEIVPRWPCEVDWSWFGGFEDRVPAVWTKLRFVGDLVIEFYGNIGMDLPKEPGYSRPSDINISFCADGINLSSGYSFIYSGWDNSRSALLKGDKVLSESAHHHFIYPHNHHFPFHQRWFYIRIEKVGNQIRCYVNSPETKSEDLVCQAVDNDMIYGGHIALWSYHNILLVARLRIWYERCEPSVDYINLLKPLAIAQRQKRELTQAVSHDPDNDFEVGLKGWAPLRDSNEVILERDATTKAGGKYSLKVTNAAGGGHFGVRVFLGQLDLKSRSVLHFAYRIPQGVKINLYFRRGDIWYALILTGSDELPMDMRMKILGRLSDVQADNSWRRAKFNLLEAFKKLEPTSPSYIVEEIVIGEFNDPPYLQAGFGGNRAGLSYYIDEFFIR
ncbi:MAG: hypothetical protein RMK18_08935 [Armatimonadota bacterium]|nr:hypothetical protein [Armatimonadota bacterium]MCX7777883.1 hypothetical protein [Armatimonadota bacterium]MDW8025967.1 hypothetical protein [Armatimonadota bacterium]